MRTSKHSRETCIVNGELLMDGFFQSRMDTEMFFETLEDKYLKAIRVQSLESDWIAREWVEGVGAVKSMIDMEMTLRCEYRSGKRHWYAYRRVLGTLYKRYVGTSEKVTQERLLEVAKSMPTKKTGLLVT